MKPLEKGSIGEMPSILLRWIFSNDKAFLKAKLAYESLFPGLFLLMAMMTHEKMQDIAVSIRIFLFSVLAVGLLIDYYLSFKRYRKSGFHVSLILLRFTFWERLSVFFIYNCIRILAVSVGVLICISGFTNIWYSGLGFILSVCAHVLLPFGFKSVLKESGKHKKQVLRMPSFISKNRFVSILYACIFANEDRISLIFGLVFAVIISVWLNVMKVPFVFTNYITSWIVTALLYDMAVSDEDMYVLNVLLRKKCKNLRHEKSVVCMALIAFFTILNVILHLVFSESMILSVPDMLWSLGWIIGFWYMIQAEMLLIYKEYPNIREHRAKFLFISLIYPIPFLNLLFCTFIFVKEMIGHVYHKSCQ